MCSSRLPDRIGKYIFVEEIGHGGYARIFKVQSSKDSQFYACKVISRSEMVNRGIIQIVEQELRVHKVLKHPNICELVDTLYDHSFIYVILEYCEKGDLYSLVTYDQSIGQTSFQRIFSGVVQSLSYLHERGLSHCDIKLENILITSDYTAKLCDFGCCEDSRLLRDKFNGTVHYLPPEIINHTPSDRRKWDIWSFGILMYVCYTRKFPWHYEDDHLVMKEISQADIILPDIIPISARIIISKCLSPDPEERPSASNLMSMPWFNSMVLKTSRTLNNKYSFPISRHKLGKLLLDPKRTRSYLSY